MVLRWPPLFFDKIHSTRLLLTNHARFFTINCILTVLQMFKKNYFWHFFAKFTFRIAITGKCSLSGYCYPESDHFPDNNNRKVKNVRTLFYLQINNVSMENQDIIILMSLSGYCYPESDHFPDSNNRKVTLKWIISFFPYLHCLFVGKKEFEHFSLSGYYDPESEDLPDSNIRKVITFRLLLSGKWSLSG